MGFPHRHYHDHLTLRAGLDNVSARFISVLSRETALLITCLRSCSIAEKLSAQSDLGKHRQPRRRRKRRVTRLLHQWHCWELPLSLKGQHVLRDWPSSERRIMERKLHRVYNSQWSFRITWTHASICYGDSWVSLTFTSLYFSCIIGCMMRVNIAL